MTKASKRHGRVYTPDYLVKVILDFGGYDNSVILKKHVIDNSCGDGAFLQEITKRYCSIFLKQNHDLKELKDDLETFIHGIELDADECSECIKNLDEIAKEYGITETKWDILNADTLTIDHYNNKMDYVFGNPPYVRVHNLENSYEAVKKYKFAEGGMTDLFIVFFEIGFNMINPNGIICLITPSSWLSSKAGYNLRKYIQVYNNLSGLIDLEHFQPFKATTYTLVSKFQKRKSFNKIEYCTFDEINLKIKFKNFLSLKEMSIRDCFYLTSSKKLSELRAVKTEHCYQYVSVKNGFATLADKVFIGDFEFKKGTIDILKASTGKWSKCIYPYDKMGQPLPIEEFKKNEEAYNHLYCHSEKLTKGRDIGDDKYWYLFGRTQALKDVSKMKYAINTIIKDKNSIKLEEVAEEKGLYSGLYILTEIEFEEIQKLIISEDFIDYIKLLKNYKSGGYYTFASKDLEHFLNFKLTEKYGQSRISNSNRELF